MGEGLTYALICNAKCDATHTRPLPFSPLPLN